MANGALVPQPAIVAVKAGIINNAFAASHTLRHRSARLGLVQAVRAWRLVRLLDNQVHGRGLRLARLLHFPWGGDLASLDKDVPKRELANSEQRFVDARAKAARKKAEKEARKVERERKHEEQAVAKVENKAKMLRICDEKMAPSPWTTTAASTTPPSSASTSPSSKSALEAPSQPASWLRPGRHPPGPPRGKQRTLLGPRYQTWLRSAYSATPGSEQTSTRPNYRTPYKERRMSAIGPIAEAGGGLTGRRRAYPQEAQA